MEPVIGSQPCCGGCLGACTASHRVTSSVATSPSGFLREKTNIQYPESLVRLLESEKMDSYTAGIELSNACREFYVKRQKDAESFKSKLSSQNSSPKSLPGGGSKVAESGSLATKMKVLKEQMSSLIDQDLLLMRQFLTLNERIEELKWQRKMESYHTTTDSTLSTTSSSLRRSFLRTHHKTASSTSSSRVMSTEYLDLKYPTPSELSLFNECSTETLGPINGDMTFRKTNKTSLVTDYEAEHEDVGESEDAAKMSSYNARTSTLDKFMFKTTASLRNSDCSNHKDVVGHCVQCPRNPVNLGQVKDEKPGQTMLRADSGHFTEGSKCSTLSSTYTDSSERHHENTSFDSGISDQENQTDFIVEV